MCYYLSKIIVEYPINPEQSLWSLKNEKNRISQTVHKISAGDLVLPGRDRRYTVVPDDNAEYCRYDYSDIGRFCPDHGKPQVVPVSESTGNACLQFLLVLLLVVGEICAPICLCEAIQKQEKTGVFSIIKKSIKALPRFFTPSGFLILLYILFITPLIGIGFSLSITESLYVPRFITEVIEKKMTYSVLYGVVLFALTLLGLIHIFVFHGILLDGDRPWDAMRRSRQYIVKHWKTIIIVIIQLTLLTRVLYSVQAFVFDTLPQHYLDSISAGMPRGYIFDIVEVETLTDEDLTLLLYRALCILQVYIGP